MILTQSEFDSFTVESSEDWNAAYHAMCAAHGGPGHHPTDYIERVIVSGLAASQLQKWAAPATGGAPLTESERASLERVTSSAELEACKKGICESRGGVHPPDWVSEMIANNKLSERIATWARPNS